MKTIVYLLVYILLLSIPSSSFLYFIIFTSCKNSFAAPTQLEHSRDVSATNYNVRFIGKIKKMAGPSFVIRFNSPEQKPAALGLHVFEKDTLVTKKSKIHLLLHSDVFLEIGEYTSVQVDYFRIKSGNHDFNLVFHHGIIQLQLPEASPQSLFYIKTSYGVFKCAPQTDLFLLEENRQLGFRVLKGSVEFIANITNEKIKIDIGGGAHIKVTGLLTKEGPIRSEQIEHLRAATRL